MKPYVIDVERLADVVEDAGQLELQGSCSVRLDGSPLDGTSRSKVRLSRFDATVLFVWLGKILTRDEVAAVIAASQAGKKASG